MAQGSTARSPNGQQVAFLRRSIAYNTTGIGTGVKIGTLPIGSKVLRTVAAVETAFNASGTNRLVVGTNSADFNNLANTTDLAETTVGNSVGLRGGALNFTQAADVYVKYTSATGTAATAGAATIIVEYVCDNQGS